MATTITADDPVARSSGISWCDLQGEVVVLRASDNAYFRLHGTARDLWMRLETRRTATELTTQALAEHSGDPAVIGAQVLEFVSQCLTLNLLERADPSV